MLDIQLHSYFDKTDSNIIMPQETSKWHDARSREQVKNVENFIDFFTAMNNILLFVL